MEEGGRGDRGEDGVANPESDCRRESPRATRACAQNVTAPKANHRTEVNNQNVVGEMSVLVLHCVLHFVQDRADFESRPCLTQ